METTDIILIAIATKTDPEPAPDILQYKQVIYKDVPMLS